MYICMYVSRTRAASASDGVALQRARAVRRDQCLGCGARPLGWWCSKRRIGEERELWRSAYQKELACIVVCNVV